jgi:hypothetical membrane protein
MKRTVTLFLRVVILLIAATSLAGMIRFPQLEGRATNLDLISIYKDPFIIYLYIASIPFFIILYQAFVLLGYIEQNKTFSKLSVRAVRNIKYFATVFIGLIVIGILYVRVFIKGDDPAGPTALGIFTIFVFTIIGVTASVFEKRLQNAINKKSK